MASAEVVTTIIDLVKDMLTYMMPIIALMSGIMFCITWFHSVVFGFGRRTFKG